VNAPAAQLRLFWGKLAPRERRGVALAGATLGGLLLWLFALAPALRSVQSLPIDIDRAELQLQQMQALAAEASGLRATPPVTSAQALAALNSATAELGAAGRLQIQGDRAVLTLSGVDGSALRTWLERARGAARARPLEAQLSRSGNGYSGTLVLGLGAPP
jgi:general secretion pathway protein M